MELGSDQQNRLSVNTASIGFTQKNDSLDIWRKYDVY